MSTIFAFFKELVCRCVSVQQRNSWLASKIDIFNPFLWLTNHSFAKRIQCDKQIQRTWGKKRQKVGIVKI